MLRILPPANDHILPQAKQEIYFFNRIGRKQPFTKDSDGSTLPRTPSVLVKSDANDCSGQMQMDAQLYAIAHRSKNPISLRSKNHGISLVIGGKEIPLS